MTSTSVRAGSRAIEPQGSQEGSYVIRPGRLIRLAAVARAMLEEARDTPCDPRGCERLRDIYNQTVESLFGLMSADLQDELANLVLPFDEVAASPSELRVAHAELVGWLEGLFTGMAGPLATFDLEASRTGGVGSSPAEPLPGLYL